MVLGWSLWGVGMAGVLGIALRAATSSARRAVALPGLLAALLLSVGQLLTLLAPPGPGLTTGVWLCGVVGITLFVAATITMLRIYLRLDALHEWLDLSSGILLAVSIVFAIALNPLADGSRLSLVEAARLLSLPALTVVALIIAALAFHAVGVTRQPRGIADRKSVV